MLDGLHHIPGFTDLLPVEGRRPAVLTQAEINALPSIMGHVPDPDSDSTARVDKDGYVYLWEPDENIGFWVQAGYLRGGRPRFGQLIDPNDIQWFNLAVFKKKLAQAKKSLNGVQLSSDTDTWDVTAEQESPRDRVSYRGADDDTIGTNYRAAGDSDLDIV